MNPADADLVQTARAGGHQAFSELVRRYAPRARAVCRARIGPRGPADDLAQEALLRAWRGLGTLLDPERFGGWLHGICVRVAQDWLKAKARGEVSWDPSLEAGLGDGRADAADGMTRRETRERVLDAVHRLPALHQEVIELFYFEDQSYDRMAAALGISSAAVNARLTKARKALRRTLRDEIEP
jgi:RNA polymerase sigma-70 factor (ECF subfamily)